MALEYILDEDKFNSLDESKQGLYKKGDNGYVLTVDGLPNNDDLSGLKAKNEQLLAELKEAKGAKGELDTLKAEQEKLKQQQEEEDAKKRGDYESLLKSQEDKHEAALKEWQDKFNGLLNERDGSKLDAEAARIANLMADGSNAEILADFVKRRLKVVDGSVKITDAQGEPTISTSDDLVKEFTESKKFDSLLRGNLAGGGGAAPQNKGGNTSETNERAEKAIKDGNVAAFLKEKVKVGN